MNRKYVIEFVVLKIAYGHNRFKLKVIVYIMKVNTMTEKKNFSSIIIISHQYIDQSLMDLQFYAADTNHAFNDQQSFCLLHTF